MMDLLTDFIHEHKIKNEVGRIIGFRDHPFLFDIYEDFSPQLCITKAAQIGATTCELIKLLYGVKQRKLDAIYCLPTDSDVHAMVGSKLNRIITQNRIFQDWTKDKDTIEQKAVGDNYVHFRGTWSQRAAIMVTSDWNLVDELDACKQDVVEQYATRLQHSKYKWTHSFSHPSAENFGVDRIWRNSTQNHWNVKCSHCKKDNIVDWPNSFNLKDAKIICTNCRKEIYPDDVRYGKWVEKFPDKETKGYWIPLWLRPSITAKEIIKYFSEKSSEYFWNKVCGKAFVGDGNKLTRAIISRNLTNSLLTPKDNEPIVIGVDTGIRLYIVAGSKKGLFYNEIADGYEAVEKLLDRWKKAIVVIDQGGDLIGSRKLREKYLGRVYLCSFGTDRKTLELVRWGTGDEDGNVIADRNRMIQLTVSEISEGRIPIQGSEADWNNFIIHWENLSRVKEYDDKTGDVKRMIWVKTGDSDLSFATVYWRIGMSRFMFNEGGSSFGGKNLFDEIPRSPEIDEDGKLRIRPMQQLMMPDTNVDDWRNN